MSFGSPTPIEVAVLGGSLQDDSAYAQKIQAQMATLPFLRDLQFAQELNYPTLDINIDRERAGQFGLTMADVVAFRRARHLLVAFHPAQLLARSRSPATPFRSRWNCRRTACRASTSWATSR